MKVKVLHGQDTMTITAGKVYDVIRAWGDGYYEYYDICNDHNEMEAYFTDRFVVVEEPLFTEQKLEKLYKEAPTHNKYLREIKPGVWVDIYDVLNAWKVIDPCLQHAAKKVLQAGERGHKDRLEDLNDVVASTQRAIEMHKEWNNV